MAQLEKQLNISDLAQEVVDSFALDDKLQKPLSLTDFLMLIGNAMRSFIEKVLGDNSDPVQKLFGDDLALETIQPRPEQQDNAIAKAFGIDKLREAMFYSLYSEGKMLRPALVFIGGLISGARLKDLLIAALAVESIHTYSLIHDDLPAMDNDEIRRGKPTNHIVFGEDMAILAGDALQTLAFSLLSSNQDLAPTNIIKQVQVLAYGAGAYGMCLGQALDIYADELPNEITYLNLTAEQKAKRLADIHIRKTAFLIRSSILLGVYSAWQNVKPYSQLEQLISLWAYQLGLTFQIKDDILDVIGNKEIMGKRGSDVDNNKLTYVSLFGIEQAQTKLEQEKNQTFAYIKDLNSLLQKQNLSPSQERSLVLLEEITTYVVERNK